MADQTPAALADEVAVLLAEDVPSFTKYSNMLARCRDELRRLDAANAKLVEALRLAVRQNSHDMLMTGDELRQCEAAIAPAPVPPSGTVGGA